MRRTTAIVAFCAAVVLAASAFAAHSAMGRATPAAGAIHGQTAAAATGTQSGQLARQLARARLATALYATDLRAAKAWLWYPNPDGLYSGTNPLIAPFNRG